MAKKKIDPLNKKAYGAVSAALTVADIPAAVSFYQKAFGFAKPRHHERPRSQADARGTHLARRSAHARAPRAQLWAGAPLRASAPRRPLYISMSKTWTK